MALKSKRHWARPQITPYHPRSGHLGRRPYPTVLIMYTDCLCARTCKHARIYANNDAYICGRGPIAYISSASLPGGPMEEQQGMRGAPKQINASLAPSRARAIHYLRALRQARFRRGGSAGACSDGYKHLRYNFPPPVTIFPPPVTIFPHPVTMFRHSRTILRRAAHKNVPPR